MSDLTARAEERVREIAAAFAVQRAYRSYRQRGVFAQMKMALLSAEAATTDGVLRRINRAEGYLARDPACAMIRARFRFAADDGEFPPRIVYKLYNCGMPVQYFSGATCFKPNSHAEKEAAKCMGQRKNLRVQRHYLARVRPRAHGIGMRTRRTLLRQVSELDQRPVYLGGRGNSWRELDGTDLTCATRFLGAGSLDEVPVKGLKQSGHVHNWHSHLRLVTTRNPAPVATAMPTAPHGAPLGVLERGRQRVISSVTGSGTRRPICGGGSVGLGASLDGRRRDLSRGLFAVHAYTKQMPRAGVQVSAPLTHAAPQRVTYNEPCHRRPLTSEQGTLYFKGGVDYNERPKAWHHVKPRAATWKSSARFPAARSGSGTGVRRAQRHAVEAGQGTRPITCPTRAVRDGPSLSSVSAPPSASDQALASPVPTRSGPARPELGAQEGYHWKRDGGHFAADFARSWPRW